MNGYHASQIADAIQLIAGCVFFLTSLQIVKFVLSMKGK